MTVALTGASGFVGRHVRAALDRAGVAHLQVERPLDDPATWGQALKTGADRFVHLAFPRRRDWATVGDAGMASFVERSSAALEEAMNAGTAHLVIISTAAVYGESSTPVSESSACRAESGYGRAKLHQERRLAEAAARAGWTVSIARIFNLLGPDQPDGYFATDLVAKLSNARESSTPIATGPLHTYRDYVDVRDVAEVLWRLPEGCFNLSRGEAVQGRALAEHLCARLGVDAARLKAPSGGGGVPFSCGDPARLQAAGLSLRTDWRAALDALIETRAL